ncbi:MAG: hypothetical protein JWQ36_3409 [Enterovirga sp.]|nr:hypothetical protein [Enterovirga sp.]
MRGAVHPCGVRVGERQAWGAPAGRGRAAWGLRAERVRPARGRNRPTVPGLARRRGGAGPRFSLFGGGGPAQLQRIMVFGESGVSPVGSKVPVSGFRTSSFPLETPK